MRKNIHYILPRQSGKTKMAIGRYFEDPDDSILVFFNQQHLEHHIRRLPKLRKTGVNITTSEKLRGYLEGRNISKFIFDEYYYYSEEVKREIVNLIHNFKIRDVYVFSSSDKLYNEGVVNYIRKYRDKIGFDYESIYDALSFLKGLNESEVASYYNNLLCLSNCTVIDKWDLDINIEMIEKDPYIRDEIYKLDIGEYYESSEKE